MNSKQQSIYTQSDQDRTGDKSQNRQGARTRYLAVAAPSRARVAPMMARCARIDLIRRTAALETSDRLLWVESASSIRRRERLQSVYSVEKLENACVANSCQT
jgi:hypothetical protein